MSFRFLRVFVFLRRRFAFRARSVSPCLATRMVAAQAGNCAAYKSVLVDSIALIRATVMAHHVPAEAADQVVHATLRSVHRMRHTYDPAVSYRAWLGAIAVHHVRRMMWSEYGRQIDYLMRVDRYKKSNRHSDEGRNLSPVQSLDSGLRRNDGGAI